MPKLVDLLEKSKDKKSEKSNKIKNLLDDKGLILFFKKGNDIFGAPEMSRILFSKMKNPNPIDDEDQEDLGDDAKFSALNLMKALTQPQVEDDIFSNQDIPKIKVIDRDDAENQLSSCSCPPSCPCKGPSNLPSNPASKFGVNRIKLRDMI